MSAIPTDDTLSRDRLSQVRRVPPTVSALLSSPAKPHAAVMPDTLSAQLRTLAVLRAVAGGVTLVAVIAAQMWLQVPLPLFPLLAGLAVLVAANVWVWQRLQSQAPVSADQYLFQLLIDLLWLANTVYWTGGAAHNLFADLLVVYVGMAALVLDVRRVLVVSAVSLSLFGLLSLFHHDVELLHAAGIDGETLETVAHLAHFVVFAVIVAYFGYRLSQTTRRYCDLVARARERELKTESAISMAALAAGTAHEMGTPLTTIAMLVGDLARKDIPLPEREASGRAIASAVQACKSSLKEMVTAIGADRISETTPMSTRQMVEQLAERFTAMRPNVPLTVTMECPRSCLVEVSAPLRQALMNLMTNAADASPVGIEVRLYCDPRQIRIDVLDRGPGIPADVMDKLGSSIVSTKSPLQGNGVGVYLANMTLTRLGGSLKYLARDGGGTCARATLPATHA